MLNRKKLGLSRKPLDGNKPYGKSNGRARHGSFKEMKEAQDKAIGVDRPGIDKSFVKKLAQVTELCQALKNKRNKFKMMPRNKFPANNGKATHTTLDAQIAWLENELKWCPDV